MVTLGSAGNIDPLSRALDPAMSVHRQWHHASILMIGRDPKLLSYKAAVLATANFAVQQAPPAEAENFLQNGAHYKVVILSHTLNMQDILRIERTVRSKKENAKVLLVIGPETDQMPLDYSKFDATVVGLDGPEAFIKTVRKLTSEAS